MFRTEIAVEFGDCDDAGISFYPNYFYWFDCTFQRLLRARGLDQRELRRRLRVVGTPVLEANAKFQAPSSYGDTIEMTVELTGWTDKIVRAQYRGSCRDRLVVDGYEVRALLRRDDNAGANDVKSLGIVPIAPLRALLEPSSA